jgi:hypothetical protein
MPPQGVHKPAASGKYGGGLVAYLTNIECPWEIVKLSRVTARAKAFTFHRRKKEEF